MKCQHNQKQPNVTTKRKSDIKQPEKENTHQYNLRKKDNTIIKIIIILIIIIPIKILKQSLKHSMSNCYLLYLCTNSENNIFPLYNYSVQYFTIMMFIQYSTALVYSVFYYFRTFSILLHSKLYPFIISVKKHRALPNPNHSVHIT